MFVTVFWHAADLRLQLHDINAELPDDVLTLLDEDESVLFNIKQKAPAGDRHRVGANELVVVKSTCFSTKECPPKKQIGL